MPRPIDQTKRDELLTHTANVLARRGIDTSLRSIAAELNTTTRMLVHYFGSRDGLVVAVLERTEIEALSLWERRLGADLRNGLLKMWGQDWFCTASAPTTRLLAQVVGAACGADSPYRDLADRLTMKLTEALRDGLIVAGCPTDRAEVRALTAVAAIQGLVAARLTSDHPSLRDAAFARLVDVLLADLEPSRRRHVLDPIVELDGERHRQSRVR